MTLVGNDAWVHGECRGLQVQLVPADRADDLTIWSDSSTQQWVSAHADVGAPPPGVNEPARQV